MTLAVLPALTRLLSPSELGQYYVWLALATVISVVLTLRFDVAIFSAKTRPEVAALIQTAVVCACALAVLCWAAWFGIQTLYGGTREMALSPLQVTAAIWMALVLAINQTSLAAYIYEARFTRQAFMKFAVATATALALLLAALAHEGVTGLIISQVVACTVVAAIVLWDIRRSMALNLQAPGILQLARTLRTYWRFPVFSMPADFISSLAAQLPLLLLGKRFNDAVAGQYGLTIKSLASPVGLLAGSILAVFKEEASRAFRQSGNCRKVYIRTLWSLALLGILPFAFLFVMAEPLFVLVFGQQWSEAGRMAAILAPMFYLKFVASPLSYTLYIANWQVYDLLWQMVLLIFVAAAFLLTQDVHTAILFYSGGYSVLYIVYLAMSYRASKGSSRSWQEMDFHN